MPLPLRPFQRVLMLTVDESPEQRAEMLVLGVLPTVWVSLCLARASGEDLESCLQQAGAAAPLLPARKLQQREELLFRQMFSRWSAGGCCCSSWVAFGSASCIPLG